MGRRMVGLAQGIPIVEDVRDLELTETPFLSEDSFTFTVLYSFYTLQ